ncbi:MAG: NAD(P)/FAD-dependent oxidoreductase [Pseudomonadota bacterium]
MASSIETDYLIIGGGAMAFAFADVIISQTDASVAVVDRYHQPGGHWNMAYPFVRLHQPSSGYGVESRALGDDQIDTQGWNEGMLELASTGEILSYYDRLLHQQLIPTGRFSYFPMCEYHADGKFSSIVSGEKYEALVKHKTVDSTYQNVTVPAMREPPFQVSEAVDCVSPDKLAHLRKGYESYTVVGAGKTAIDTCLWLLSHGVDANRIRWIMPRDSWLINRAYSQPGPQFAEMSTQYMTSQFNAVNEAGSTSELFELLEKYGNLLRIDPAVKPTMYRCATVSEKELAALQSITEIVRMGRVKEIGDHQIVLDEGTIATSDNILHIDCTADGLEKRPSKPVFDGSLVTLQSVRACQQVFSAAFIAHVETAYDDESKKNEICAPIPHPDTDLDWIRVTKEFCRSERLWGDDVKLREWLLGSRLNWVWKLGAALPDDKNTQQEFFAARTQLLMLMEAKLATFMTD